MKWTPNSLPLGQLLARSAAATPNALFSRLSDAPSAQVAMRAAEIEQRADGHMRLWLAAGLSEGARVGMIATPEPETLAAIVGAVRAGVEVVLMSPALDAPAIAASAGLARAPALAGPSEFAGIDYAKRLAEARAAAGAVTWLMLWEADRPRMFRLDNAMPMGATMNPEQAEAGLAIAHETGVQALDSLSLRSMAGQLVDALEIKTGETIVSLISPATPAGLIVSAHAPLIAGANLIWQAPFSALIFEQALRDHGMVHLVVPAAIVAELGRATLLASERLSSLTIVVPESAPPPLFEADLDADRVFFLDARLGGARPLSALSSETYAEEGELR